MEVTRVAALTLEGWKGERKEGRKNGRKELRRRWGKEGERESDKSKDQKLTRKGNGGIPWWSYG